MIQAILFDLDNTLTDFMVMKHRSIEAAVSAMIDAGLNVKKESAIVSLYKVMEKHGWENSKIFQLYLKEELGKIDHKILAGGIVAYRRAKAGSLAPYPRVQKTLLALKMRGIKLAIVTDAPRMRAWIRLTTIKLAEYFDFVVTFEDTKKAKPHSLPFKKAIEKLDIPPEHILMIGDMPHKDIEGAQKLGMKTCFARYGYQKKIGKTKADYDIKSFEKLLDIVEKENKIK